MPVRSRNSLLRVGGFLACTLHAFTTSSWSMLPTALAFQALGQQRRTDSSRPGLRHVPTCRAASAGTAAPRRESVPLQQPPASAKRADFRPDGVDPNEQLSQDMHLKRIRSAGKYPVLVVNSDCTPLSFVPLSVITWQEAIKAIFLDRVTVLSYYDSYIMSTRSKVQLPSVVALKHYRKPHRERGPALNRRNVYLRDSSTCQYCASRLHTSDLTLDHVVPRCKGGIASWTNLVTCCKPCNKRKGHRSVNELKEVGMMLLRPPKKPSRYELEGIAKAFKAKSVVHETWLIYLGLTE